VSCGQPEQKNEISK
jgi:hypothetical protein